MRTETIRALTHACKFAIEARTALDSLDRTQLAELPESQEVQVEAAYSELQTAIERLARLSA